MGEVNGAWSSEVVVRKPELLRRIAAVRKAKIAKARRTGFDSLDEEELDEVLGKLLIPPERPIPPRGPGKSIRPTLPCVVCGDPGGFVPTNGRRPRRVDVGRFGIPGEACRRCYDRIKAPVQRPRRRLERAS